MSISSTGQVSLLDSVLPRQTPRDAVDVAVLKKAQDVMKQQGEALLHLLEKTGPSQLCRMLDAYA